MPYTVHAGHAKQAPVETGSVIVVNVNAKLAIRVDVLRIYNGLGRKQVRRFIARVGDLEASSPTSAVEAKQRLEQGAANALQGSYEPVVIRYGGLCGVAWRTPFASQALNGELEPESWCYTIRSDDSARASTSGCTTYGAWNRTTVERDLRRHMAQMLGVAGEPLLSADDEGLREHRGHEAWQAAYAQAQLDGLNDELSRAQADEASYAVRRAS
jgi:hypothetical protein